MIKPERKKDSLLKGVINMKKFLVLIIISMLASFNVYAEEKKLPDNCYSEYKVSPSTLGCKFKKGIGKLTTKSDGSRSMLGKIFDSKSLKDLKK